jgi:hypothetical protein
MTAFHLRTAILVTGLALAAGPALAQKAGPAGGGGGGGNGGGGGASNAGGGGATTSGGSVVSSGGGGGGSTSSSSSSGSSSPSASGGFSSSGSASSYHGQGATRTAAPEHRTSFSYSDNQHATATPRVPSGRTATASSATSASPRADASHAVARGAGSKEAAANNPAGNREVPGWSRARGDHPTTGTAVPRSPDNPAPGTAAYYQYYLGRYGSYNPYYYDPIGFYGFYGLGGGYYGFYNPYYSPYGFGGYGLDPGFGYPYYGDPNDPYMYGEGYGSYSTRVYSGQGEGALKLKVKPRNAKVYVDGYFVGIVDQFDGMKQKLTLNGGNHKVEVKADGYETAEFDVLITPGQTLTFAGDLKKLQ